MLSFVMSQAAALSQVKPGQGKSSDPALGVPGPHCDSRKSLFALVLSWIRKPKLEIEAHRRSDEIGK